MLTPSDLLAGMIIATIVLAPVVVVMALAVKSWRRRSRGLAVVYFLVAWALITIGRLIAEAGALDWVVRGL